MILQRKKFHTLQSYLDSRHFRFNDKYIKSSIYETFSINFITEIIVGVCSAQTEHMKFKGVPMEGTLQSMTCYVMLSYFDNANQEKLRKQIMDNL